MPAKTGGHLSRVPKGVPTSTAVHVRGVAGSLSRGTPPTDRPLHTSLAALSKRPNSTQDAPKLPKSTENTASM